MAIFHADERMWFFDFETSADASKFEFSLSETKRCLAEGSIYMRAVDLNAGRSRSYGYDSVPMY